MLEMMKLDSRESWLRARSGRIGGSDAACVIGLNPYKTNVRLWEEKTGLVQPEDISSKPCVRYGHDAEDHLRDLFALDFPEYQVLYEPDNLWLNDKYPFAHASLDGWLIDQEGCKGILEIKTSEIMGAAQSRKWKDRIPDNYYCQVLHYLLVTEWDFAVLKAQLKYDIDGDLSLRTVHYHIDRNEVREDIEMLRRAEERFWQQCQRKERPALILPDV